MGNTQSSPHASIDTPTTYPITKKATNTSNNSSKSLKKPQPYVGSFFDGHMATPLPHKQATKPNRPAGHVNFFEVAAVTQQPARSVKSNSSSKSSSLKTSASSSVKKSSSSSVYPNSSHISGSTTKKYSDSIATSTTAVTDQVKELSLKDKLHSADFAIVNKRKYWKGKGSQNFMLPCDDDELDRIMTLHYILKATFHGSFTAPVNKLLSSGKPKVLDIGCGSGTWILEMASEFPNAEFYGIDDCPLFPKHIKPGNSHFQLHNVNQGLPYPDNEFDYVYMRCMTYYFTPEELSQLLSEIARVMKPGGYFEIVDTNYTIRHAGPLSNKMVNNDLKQTMYTSSTNMTFATQHESNINHPIFSFLMLAPQHPSVSFVGSFIDICQEHATLPLGSWEGGQLGKLHSLNFELFLSSIQCKNPPITPFKKQTLDDIMDECERYKSYLDWFACYARKPPLENQQIEQSTLDSIYEFVEGFVDV